MSRISYCSGPFLPQYNGIQFIQVSAKCDSGFNASRFRALKLCQNGCSCLQETFLLETLEKTFLDKSRPNWTQGIYFFDDKKDSNFLKNELCLLVNTFFAVPVIQIFAWSNYFLSFEESDQREYWLNPECHRRSRKQRNCGSETLFL